MSNILEIKGISKEYPGTLALDNVSFNVEKGEILAICGENGAGKSTLIKSISGAIKPSKGEIIYEGIDITKLNPHEIIALGISVIYQELNLFPNLTVYQNIFYGNEIKSVVGLNNDEMIKQTNDLLKSFNLDIDACEIVGDLSIASQQIVEILKSVARNSKLIIMDEPTSSLAENEVNYLLKLTETLKKSGITIIYISHKLEEVIRLSDHIVILRDGKYVDTLDKNKSNQNLIIKKMVGRELEDIYPDKSIVSDYVKLECVGISNKYLDNISFSLKKGEILGFGGLVGSGRTELMRVIFGADSKTSGKIFKDGNEIEIKKPIDAIRNSIALVPEDRKIQGLILNKSLIFNTILPNTEKYKNKFNFLNITSASNELNESVNELNIKISSISQKANSLSGGNQQKIVLAKWLINNCDILILDEPTRGIDVGSKQEIYNIIKKLSDLGKSIIVVSSEMPELIGLSNRILVMSDGKISGELEGEDMTQENIMTLASKEMREIRYEN